MTALWLQRHAQPLVAAGTCYGRSDMAADDKATAEAAQQLLAAWQAEMALPPSLWHSPLQRCEQLALSLQALAPELTTQVEPALAEMDFGAWEGQPWDAVPRAELDAWAADLHAYAPGGGEPLAAMLARVRSALEEPAPADTDRVWISHAGVARCVHWLRTQPARPATAAAWTQAAPAPGQWFIS